MGTCALGHNIKYISYYKCGPRSLEATVSAQKKRKENSLRQRDKLTLWEGRVQFQEVKKWKWNKAYKETKQTQGSMLPSYTQSRKQPIWGWMQGEEGENLSERSKERGDPAVCFPGC